MSYSVGHPPIIKNKADLITKIDKYFEDCKGEVLLDKEGNPMLNKYGDVVMVGYAPYTMTGLALALGMNSRQTLLNYSLKDEYMDTIACARTKVQEFAERSLYNRDTCNGAKFNLANNFKWSEKQEINSTVKETKTLDMSKFTVDQLKDMMKSDK